MQAANLLGNPGKNKRIKRAGAEKSSHPRNFGETRAHPVFSPLKE